jgi:hypothetical protein
MPNNLDQYQASNNKHGLEMRDLLEILKDKQQSFYYSDVLILNGRTLGEFINGRN